MPAALPKSAQREGTFVTLRNRSKITKGPGSRTAGPAIAYKLIEAARSRWRAINAHHLVALVRAGARFHNGKLLEPLNNTADKQAARRQQGLPGLAWDRRGKRSAPP